jgi:hypothetical protein
MFSTANRTDVSEAIVSRPTWKRREYSRCHRNGGWTTTVCAPSISAAN